AARPTSLVSLDVALPIYPRAGAGLCGPERVRLRQPARDDPRDGYRRRLLLRRPAQYTAARFSAARPIAMPELPEVETTRRGIERDRKSTRLNSSHVKITY